MTFTPQLGASQPAFSDDRMTAPPPPTSLSAVPPVAARLLATPVLIVEDEAVIAWTLESLLEDLGFTDIAIAADARGAIASAATRAPGLIISDINLGTGLDGVAAAASIHRAGFVPTLFVTGYANADARARIDREVPGASVLRKPIQVDALRGAVAAALGGGTH